MPIKEIDSKKIYYASVEINYDNKLTIFIHDHNLNVIAYIPYNFYERRKIMSILEQNTSDIKKVINKKLLTSLLITLIIMTDISCFFLTRELSTFLNIIYILFSIILTPTSLVILIDTIRNINTLNKVLKGIKNNTLINEERKEIFNKLNFEVRKNLLKQHNDKIINIDTLYEQAHISMTYLNKNNEIKKDKVLVFKR